MPGNTRHLKSGGNKVMLSFSIRKWEAYVGMPQQEICEAMKKTCKELGVSYDIANRPPLFMYDSKHNQIVFQMDGLKISLIYVSADPLNRAFSTILGTAKLQGGITLLSAELSGNRSGSDLKKILKSLVGKLPMEPWRIRHHPRFQFAVLLQLLNRWRWTSMLKTV
jgi:hypothetical protein